MERYCEWICKIRRGIGADELGGISGHSKRLTMIRPTLDEIIENCRRVIDRGYEGLAHKSNPAWRKYRVAVAMYNEAKRKGEMKWH